MEPLALTPTSTGDAPPPPIPASTEPTRPTSPGRLTCLMPSELCGPPRGAPRFPSPRGWDRDIHSVPLVPSPAIWGEDDEQTNVWLLPSAFSVPLGTVSSVL